MSEFLFMTCQVGAEPTLKRELARYRPSFRFAYSRPGFLTFKLPENHRLPDDFALHSVFARSYGFSLGKVDVADPAAAAGQVWSLAAGRDFQALHAWSRDRLSPGEHGYEPGRTDDDRKLAQQILRENVLAAWAERCGSECAREWNATVGQVVGVEAPAD